MVVQWKTWPEMFGLTGDRGAGPYALSYFLYLLWAIFFATLAAMLVRVFAPYACGSGIPEVSFCIPEVRICIPEVGFCVPEVSFCIPEVSSCIPEVSFSVPEVCFTYQR
jgi:hypothetical protein